MRLVLATLLALALAVPAAGETIVFSDGSFYNWDWDVTVCWTLGDGGVVDGSYNDVGGNPFHFRVVYDHVLPAPDGGYGLVAGFHRHIPSVYDPAQGDILTLDYAEDAIMLFGAGQGQGGSPALRQDGEVYIAGVFITPETVWTPHVMNGLTQDDFHLQDDATVHPDFSAQGEPIEFGFVRRNSTYAGGYVILGGIDNWSFTLHTAGPVATVATTWSGVKALFE